MPVWLNKCWEAKKDKREPGKRGKAERQSWEWWQVRGSHSAASGEGAGKWDLRFEGDSPEEASSKWVMDRNWNEQLFQANVSLSLWLCSLPSLVGCTRESAEEKCASCAAPPSLAMDRGLDLILSDGRLQPFHWLQTLDFGSWFPRLLGILLFALKVW